MSRAQNQLPLEDLETESRYTFGLTKEKAVRAGMILCRTPSGKKFTLYTPSGPGDTTKTADTVRGQHHYVHKVGHQSTAGLTGGDVLRLCATPRVQPPSPSVIHCTCATDLAVVAAANLAGTGSPTPVRARDAVDAAAMSSPTNLLAWNARWTRTAR